jgi:hypothetical protein
MRAGGGMGSKVSYCWSCWKNKLWWPCKHGLIPYTCKYWNISVVSAVFIENFQHNQQYDTLLPVTPCAHKLKAGIANWEIWTAHQIEAFCVGVNCGWILTALNICDNSVEALNIRMSKFELFNHYLCFTIACLREDDCETH